MFDNSSQKVIRDFNKVYICIEFSHMFAVVSSISQVLIENNVKI